MNFLLYGMVDAGALCIALLIALAVVPTYCGVAIAVQFIFSIFRKRSKMSPAASKSRIVVLIPAHNEEKVITSSIESVWQSKYPCALYDIIVIADNCTDQTEGIARKAGAKVMVRTDPFRKNKAAALKWALWDQGVLKSGYDAVCILDADTVIDQHFLRHMDAQLQRGHTVVQGRALTSNEEESFISGAMSIFESMQHHFWHVPLARLGKTDLYTGKGVCITCDQLEKTGWNIDTLVEDAEFSIKLALEDGRVQYCEEALFYSEQAQTVTALWRQQRRWCSGHIDCMQRFFANVLRKTIRSKKDMLSVLTYLLLPVNMAAGFLQLFLSPLLMARLMVAPLPIGLTLALSVCGQLLANMVGAMIILFIDGKLRLKHLPFAIVFPLLPMSLGFLYFYSFIKPKKSWEPMLHMHTIRTRETQK